jgi:hypothetical protein
MIRSVFVIFLTTCFQQLVAQGNYRPGFVIENNGDTLKGSIDYKRWDRSPTKIGFKSVIQSKFYTPLDIKSFTVANEIYISAIVDVDRSPHKITELDNSPHPVYAVDTVFLQSLIQGEKSLLHLKDENAKNHFYIVDNGSFVPLVYKQYTTETKESSKAVTENMAYRGVLALYLKNVPDLQRKLGKTHYNSGSLTKLFEYYYEHSSTPMAYSNKRQEGRFEWGIATGASFTTLDFSGPVEYLSELELDPSVNPVLGFFCDVKLLRSNGWRISNDFFYSAFNFDDEVTVEAPPGYTAIAAFKFQYIKTAHMLQMNLLRKRSLYVAGGLSTGFAFTHNSTTTIIYNGGGTESTRDFDARKFEFGYVGGFGFHASRWNVEARYEYSASGISNIATLDSEVSRMFILVKYKISH